MVVATFPCTQTTVRQPRPLVVFLIVHVLRLSDFLKACT
jgi:hypothetical protein